jgi:hypothetical protein
LPLKKLPSQTAQYETPRPKSTSSPGTFSFLRRAPIAKIIVAGVYGCLDVSTRRLPGTGESAVTSAVTNTAPSAFACSAICRLSEKPSIAEKPGMFSISGVVAICPPAIGSFSKTITESPARRAYTAAVKPAGPPPIINTSGFGIIRQNLLFTNVVQA